MTHFHTQTLSINTGHHETIIDLTDQCQQFLATNNTTNGLLNIFVPHATAGIAIIETGAGSDEDLLAALRDLLPADDRWRHQHGTAGHGRDHVLPGIVTPHATLPVINGELALGTWQSVTFVDTNVDNPHRHVRLSFLG